MSFNKVVQYSLPNGMFIKGFGGTEHIIEEVWEKHCYDEYISLEEGMTVLDIGANQGVFAIYAASKGCDVHCYEPYIKNYEILSENIRNNYLENKVKYLMMRYLMWVKS